MSYSLLIISDIPIYKTDHGWSSLDLWVKDAGTNRAAVKRLCLVSSYAAGRVPEHTMPFPADIEIVTHEEIGSDMAFKDLISGFDVIQVSTGRPVWQCRLQFRAIRIARSLGKCIICCISSDRAKSTILNASNKTILHKLKASVIAKGIMMAVRRMALASNGLFLVGHGLVKNFNFNHPALKVQTASWISERDIIGKDSLEAKLNRLREHGGIQLCVATRLEPSKGVHLSIEAMGSLIQKSGKDSPRLFIYGKGPEIHRLKELAAKLKIDDKVFFQGTVPYGETFYKEIRQYDLMLLTNLSDEQPRLIFDALSQGMIPICPDTPSYSALPISPKFLYKPGNAKSLSDSIALFLNKDFLSSNIRALCIQAANFTIDKMHADRAEWVSNLLKRRL